MSYYPSYQPPPGSAPGPGTPGAAGYPPGQHQYQQMPYFPPPPGTQGAHYPPPPPGPPPPPADAGPPIPTRPSGYEAQSAYLSPHHTTPQPQWTSNIAGRQYQVHFAPPPKSPTRPPQLPPRPGSAAPPPGPPQGYFAPPGQGYPPQAAPAPYGYQGYQPPPPPAGPPPAQAPSPYQGAPPGAYPPPPQAQQQTGPSQNYYQPPPQAPPSYGNGLSSGYQAQAPPPPLPGHPAAGGSSAGSPASPYPPSQYQASPAQGYPAPSYQPAPATPSTQVSSPGYSQEQGPPQYYSQYPPPPSPAAKPVQSPPAPAYPNYASPAQPAEQPLETTSVPPPPSPAALPGQSHPAQTYTQNASPAPPAEQLSQPASMPPPPSPHPAYTPANYQPPSVEDESHQGASHQPASANPAGSSQSPAHANPQFHTPNAGQTAEPESYVPPPPPPPPPGPQISVSTPEVTSSWGQPPAQTDGGYSQGNIQANNTYPQGNQQASPAQPAHSQPAFAGQKTESFSPPPPPSQQQQSPGNQQHGVDNISNMMQSMSVDPGPSMNVRPQIPQSSTGPPMNDLSHGNPAGYFPPPPTSAPPMTEPVQGHRETYYPPPPPHDSYQGAPYQAAPPPPQSTYQETQYQTAPPPPSQTYSDSPATSAYRDHSRQDQARRHQQIIPRKWSERCMKYGIKTTPICVDTVVNISTTWYTHPSAPCALICSRCYVDHIYPTVFKDEFKGESLKGDGTARLCRFAKDRASEYLLPQAVVTGNLQPLLDYMNARLDIPDCKGTNGVNGEAGIKFWRAKNDAIPGLVVCEACIEDVVKASGFQGKFEPAPGQGAKDVWSCDLAVTYVYRMFKETDKTGDWAAFGKSASLRLFMPPCPGFKMVSGETRNFYTPKQGPQTFCICEGCYYDRVVGVPSQESQWFCSIKMSPKNPNAKASCDMIEFNIMMPMLISLERKEPVIFFDALKRVTGEPHCEIKGTVSKNWYTLKSDPEAFAVCGACYHGALEPWGIGRFFKPKAMADPSTPTICCLNPGHVRFQSMVQGFLHTMYQDDPADWHDYADKYAGVASCPRDQDSKNGVWYGWPTCTICPECYLEFVKDTPLDGQFPLRRAVRERPTMCEMYSPRMRALYKQACERGDPTELCAFSDSRRIVYNNTVVRIRQIMSQQRIAMMEQQRLNGMSLFYTSLGRMQANTIGSSYTYGQAGVGYGFSTSYELDGARYGQQAQAVVSDITSGRSTMQVAELERQWREVE